MPELLELSYTNTSMGQLQQTEDPFIFSTSIFRIQSFAGIEPLNPMFYFSCRFTKNCVFAWQFTKFWVIMSQGLFAKLSFDIAYTQSVKLKALRFLKGIGGILIWFFFAGILITGVSSSGLQRSLMQMICGTSHFAKMGRQTGCRLSSCISKNPSIVQFSLTGGILTATFTCARSLLRILNLTSSKYSNLSLLRTEKTYSSRSLNSALLHLAITRSMKGFEPLSSMISSLRPIEMSTSSMDPGKRVDRPNIMLVRLMSTKYFVSFSSVESCYASALASGYGAGAGCSARERSLIRLSIVGCWVSGDATGQNNTYREEDRLEAARKLGLARVISRSFAGQIKNSQILSNYHPQYQTYKE